MSRVNHPNIVKFIGVHCGRDKFDLTLFLEPLPFKLSTFLFKNHGLPSSIQHKIVCDISSGLRYLHSKCFVIHGNLTASSILMTSENQAKIGEFQCACFVNDPIGREVLNIDLTYKAPEIDQEQLEYTVEMDIFSMGVLCLHVATQQIPELIQTDVPDDVTKHGQSEIYKRKRWIDEVVLRQPELSPIIQLCLSDNPETRPSSSYLNILLEEIIT